MATKPAAPKDDPGAEKEEAPQPFRHPSPWGTAGSVKPEEKRAPKGPPPPDPPK